MQVIEPTHQSRENLQSEHISLPEQPLVVIEPGKRWVSVDLGALWAYRELLYFLTWRDIKVRYKQTALGVLWAIIQPLLTMLISSLIFGYLGGFSARTDGIPYPIFAYAGLLPWTFFSNSVTASGNSLVGSSSLITKVYFPRMIIPSAAVAAGLVDFAIAFVLLVALLIYYKITVTLSVLMLAPLTLLVTMLALGIGMWLSALNVKYRDVRYALPFLMQIWMFLSPIIYPVSMLPPSWRWVLWLNPLTGIISGFRAALFGSAFDWTGIAISTGITLFLLVYSSFSFRRMEKSFADVV